MAVTDNLAPSENKHIKDTSQDMFDAEIMEKINEKDKLSKKFKNSCLNVNKDIYNEARGVVQKLIRTKKKAFVESKLSENIGKTKELWKSLKSLGLKFECSVFNNCLEDDKSANFDVKDIAKEFSAYFSNLAENLVSRLPNPSNKFGECAFSSSILQPFRVDYQHKKMYLIKTLRDIDISEASGIKRLPRRLVKNGVDVLAKPVTDVIFQCL